MNQSEDDLVTIAVLQNATIAILIKNQLEAIGIKVYLGGEEAVAMGSLMAGALGGIGVQVATRDRDDALLFLEREPWKDKPDPTALVSADTLAATREEDEPEYSSHREITDPTAFASAETVAKLPAGEEPETLLSDRETSANHAVRAAVFGLILAGGLPIAGLGHDHALGRAVFFLIFLGFEAYAARLLFTVYFSKGRLVGRPRTNAKIATAVTGSLFLFSVLMVVMAFVGPIRARGDVDLRNYNHPAVMVGSWTGSVHTDKGETKILLELKRNGKVRWSETGPDAVECTGTWAFENWTFYVCYDRFQKGDDPSKGKILGYPVKDFKESEMFLDTADGRLRLTRQK